MIIMKIMNKMKIMNNMNKMNIMKIMMNKMNNMKLIRSDATFLHLVVRPAGSNFSFNAAPVASVQTLLLLIFKTFTFLCFDF